MKDFTTIHLRAYWLVPSADFHFALYDGYIESESNFHYARFCGFDKVGSRIWLLESSDIPSNAITISRVDGDDLIRRSWIQKERKVIEA